MKAPRRRSSSQLIKLVNLEEGMPTGNEARLRLDHELHRARQEGLALLKLVHGYGSSGVGGELRSAIQQSLAERVRAGQIRAFIAGEDWRVSDPQSWELLQRRPELKRDKDLGRGNRGISIVVL